MSKIWEMSDKEIWNELKRKAYPYDEHRFLYEAVARIFKKVMKL